MFSCDFCFIFKKRQRFSFSDVDMFWYLIVSIAMEIWNFIAGWNSFFYSISSTKNRFTHTQKIDSIDFNRTTYKKIVNNSIIFEIQTINKNRLTLYFVRYKSIFVDEEKIWVSLPYFYILFKMKMEHTHHQTQSVREIFTSDRDGKVILIYQRNLSIIGDAILIAQ